MDNFWKKYVMPTQDFFDDVETINPAEAYRRQADAINYSGPIYAEIEHIEARLARINRVEKELRTRILKQNLQDLKSTFRSSELIDAFILEAATYFIMPNGNERDVSENLINLSRVRQKLEARLKMLNKRIQAIEAMADKCDRILNWAKHEARLHTSLGG